MSKVHNWKYVLECIKKELSGHYLFYRSVYEKERALKKEIAEYESAIKGLESGEGKVTFTPQDLCQFVSP